MAVRAGELPPGPRFPGPLATLGWLKRPVPLLLRAQARYGDAFTFTVAAPEGPWVFLADPAAIREVFRGSAEDLRAGEGNAILEPLLGAKSVLLLGHRRAKPRWSVQGAPRPAQAAATAVSWRAHGALP